MRPKDSWPLGPQAGLFLQPSALLCVSPCHRLSFLPRRDPSITPRSELLSLPTYLRDSSHLWWTQQIRRGQTATYNGRASESYSGHKGNHFVGQAGTTRGHSRKSFGTLRHMSKTWEGWALECPFLRPVPPAVRKPPVGDIVGNLN